MILTVCLNPGVDKTIFVDEIKPEKFIYPKEVLDIAGGKSINVAEFSTIWVKSPHCF